MGKYTSMLSLDECVEVFSVWVQDKLDATTNLVLKKVGADKAKAEFNIGPTKCTATITMNYNSLGYCDAVMHAYHRGHAEPVHIKRAIENYGGTDRDSNKWVKLSFDRWKERQGQKKSNRSELKASPTDNSARLAANEKAQAEVQYNVSKRVYLDDLPGAVMAQYIYKAAKALQAPQYHQNQVVKTPDRHRYIIKKGFEDPKDFLIIPNHVPTVAQVIKFIESDKFDMPENPYGFVKQDIINRIVNPPPPISPNAPPPEPFNPKRYITDKDVSLGVGIMPSMDLNGVITNIQKYLVEPLPNGTDKIFGTEAIVRGSFYVFDHESKINSDFKPKAVVITEGWATGRSLDDTFKKSKSEDIMVVVAWNAGQIKNALKICGEHYPEANLIIATDNDVKSFYYANESKPKDYKLIRNTGLHTAIDSYHSHPEFSNRLSIITPPVNHEALDGNPPPSDFNDIENQFGKDYLKQCITKEVIAAIGRRAEGIDEIPRLMDTYNAQVKYFSEKHNIPLQLIEKTGDLSVEPYMPKALIEAQNEASLKAELAEDDLINQMASSTSMDFLNVDINNDIKSDFDKKMEQSAQFLGGSQINEANVTNVVANTFAPTIDAPAEQPIVDPATFTTILYHSHLFNSFNQIQKLDNKQEMLEALEAKPMSMDAATKVMQAMFDNTINPHLPAMIGSVMEDYKNESFYQDLTEIKNLMDDNFIKINQETIQCMQDTQRQITNAFISENTHKGLDEEVAHKMFAQEISEQPIEAKRALFTEIRETMRSLDSRDAAWLHSIKETLLESKDVASHITANTAKNEARVDYDHTP